MLDAYIIKQIHQDRKTNRPERSQIQIRRYYPESSQDERRKQKENRGIEVVDFTI